jgi:hypothetical protein
MPSEYQRYMITQFSSNPTVAVVYMSLPDDAHRLDYATDLYKVHNQGEVLVVVQTRRRRLL